MNLKSKTSANQPTTSNATNECDTPRKKNLRRKVQTFEDKIMAKRQQEEAEIPSSN